jgi:PBP1b-binding outer membrane lipoprotein LpoB
MRRVDSLLTIPLLALLLAGCAPQQQSSGSKDFKGEEKKVADVIGDLRSAGQRRDAQKICSEVLSAKLVDQLKSGGSTCVDEMDKAVNDADDYDLTVQDVTVDGDTATAKVKNGDDGPTATLEFAKERAGWRATSLG